MATATQNGMTALPLEKIQIAGATLASLLQLVTTSPGDISGLLFGHVTHLTSQDLSDDTDAVSTPITIATITNALLLPDTHTVPNLSQSNVIGWFSGRRQSPLRPSLRESTISKQQTPLIFLLITSPPPDGNSSLIHTLEYRAYQFSTQSSPKFLPRSLNVINLGPSFRRHYDSFAPTSPFPGLACDFRGLNSMVQDSEEDGDAEKRVLEGMGIDVEKLSALIGPEAANYTKHLEDTVKGMLDKLEELTILAHESDARVAKQLKIKKGEGRTNVENVVEDEGGQSGKEEGKSTVQQLITYQRRRKRGQASAGKPPLEQLLLTGCPMLRQNDEVGRSSIEEKMETGRKITI